MEKRTNKNIIFNSFDEAERFCNLYEIPIMNMCSTDSHFGEWFKEYYGLQGTKYIVSVRRTNSEMESIMNAIGLKKAKRNNHLLYLYN